MKAKRWISLWLLVLMVVSMMDASILKVDAATDDTKYSIKSLQNGSFEEYEFDGEYSQPVKSAVGYWDTTAFGNKFEFFKSGSPHFKKTKNKYPNNSEYIKVAEGEYAAELNADEESTIYQRIKTVASSTYTWGLAHRGRDVTDRMVLFIGPEQPVDPSKPSKTQKDQFVRITDWLKEQYEVEYPYEGCSQKFTVYSKPFAVGGEFENEATDEDQNISLVETNEINQEWSVWIISSPYCNTSTTNGWSQYGTNIDTIDFDDIMKGPESSLGYDCTYTVPNGQTETLFAFCSYSSGTESGPNATYGNLLDDINFDLYQPLSTSISEGGKGGVYDTEHKLSNITIISGNPLHTVVGDGETCTIYTSAQDVENGLTDCTFQGAYITTNNADGTSVTNYVRIYTKETDNLSDADLEELSKQYFIPDKIADPTTGKQRYYHKISVESPVKIHLIYSKAPFVLYDANGGQEYYFSPDNTIGGNLIGFGDYFQRVLDKVVDGESIYVDTSEYYYDFEAITDDNKETIIPGKYTSHAALPNKKWETYDNGTSPHRFCGWSVLNAAGERVVLDGVHTIEFNPSEGNGGIVSFTDSDGTISGLQLDATHGVTLTALWKFANRAYVQTYNSETGYYENSAVGGTITETMIPENLRGDDVKEVTAKVGKENRVSEIEALGKLGDTIMFKARADYENDYRFVGWYFREKQKDGTYKEVLKTTSTSIAVTVEEGKLNTYYARFKKMSEPVVFHYSSTGSGSSEDYDYYDKSDENPYGKYLQNVLIDETAVKPTGDSESVKTWFTSPTERGSEYIFDFNTHIQQETHLYAGPQFTYNYFNNFRFSEPWNTRTYATLKFNGQYIDLKNNPDVSDYNVYMLKGTLDGSAPTPTDIRNNENTIKIGKAVNSENLLFNTETKTNQKFSRVGAKYTDLHIFDMNTPVWVMFDFTYKGVRYTSTVKDRSLYNNIDTYMGTTNENFFTTLPPETEAELRQAQTTLLDKIKGLYDAVKGFGIQEPTQYADASAVSGLYYNPEDTNDSYKFTSTTAIRNIEPWGLKYSFNVEDNNGNTVTGFADYGAVVLTDKNGSLQEDVSVGELLDNENSVMYSKTANNIYGSENGAIDVYYINDLRALDFDKTTYVVFFVKGSDGNYHYSSVVKNNYKNLAEIDQSEYRDVSQSILQYSDALKNYLTLMNEAETGQNP